MSMTPEEPGGWFNPDTGQWEDEQPRMASYADEQIGAQQEGPVTPYPEPGGEGATSGWSGSETSHERAVEEDANGTTRERQVRTLRLLAARQGHGLTVKDLREATGWHHGQASSALSVLHKEGQIARLKERRDRCAIYTLHMYVGERETAEPGRNRGRVQPLNHTDDAVLRRVRFTTRIDRDSGDKSSLLWHSDIEHLLAMIDKTYDTKEQQ